MTTTPQRSRLGLTCNIDARGRRARRGIGLACLGLALIDGVTIWVSGAGAIGYAATGLLGFVGVFALFEAANGWCVVRAMGFKTPL